MAKWEPRKAAERGAVYLDAVKPDWFRCITLNTLQLSDNGTCVLGQCFGDYFNALTALVPAFNGYDPDLVEEHANRRQFAETFGFQVPRPLEDRGGYERLGLAWKALIVRRRKTRRSRTTA